MKVRASFEGLKTGEATEVEFDADSVAVIAISAVKENDEAGTRVQVCMRGGAGAADLGRAVGHFLCACTRAVDKLPGTAGLIGIMQLEAALNEILELDVEERTRERDANG